LRYCFALGASITGKVEKSKLGKPLKDKKTCPRYQKTTLAKRYGAKKRGRKAPPFVKPTGASQSKAPPAMKITPHIKRQRGKPYAPRNFRRLRFALLAFAVAL
jgi:hypothetical protein